MEWKPTVTHPRRNMHPGGLIEEADISEKNKSPSLNYRPAL